MDRTFDAVQERLAPGMRDVSSVAEALETAAATWPDATYMTYAPTGESVTFRELDRGADRLAAALASAGVGKGDRVGLYLTNGPEYVRSIFACAKLGAIQTPINWLYREREVRHAVDTAGVSTAVVQPGEEYVGNVAAVAPDFDGLERVIVTEGTPPAIDGAETHALSDLESAAGDDAPDVRVEEDDPCSIIYTSGTTGLPKPALLSNRSYLLAAKSFVPALPEGDVNYNPYPLFHGNNQLYSMLGSVLAGTGYVLSDTFSASGFFEEVVGNGVTSFNVIGGVPKMLDATYDADGIPDNDLEVAIGPIATETWEGFEEKFDLRVVQIYAQTESPTLLMNHPDPERIRVGAIGKPMFPDLGHETTVVDDDGDPVPTGEEGELTRTDPGAMTGYFEMPEKTTETLRDGVVYSGDVVRADDDGYLYYVDRKKFMIRRSGENIAPREVENVIDEHPGVEESAVIPVPDEFRGEEVKAMVKRAGDVTEEDVVGRVADQLAAYKVPRYVEFVDSFPKTPSERIKRVQLADEEGERDGHGWDREARSQ